MVSYDLHTGRESALTHWPAGNHPAKWPAISPDGKRLAYVAFSSKAGMVAIGVAVLNLESGEEKLFPGFGIPHWTDDNDYIVCNYDGKKNGDNPIVLLNVRTGEKTEVTHNGAWNDFPAWVPGK